MEAKNLAEMYSTPVEPGGATRWRF